MDFNQVRYFLALSDTLNFTRAAERCSVSQPALTQAIKRLEDELGGQLITREGVDSELTNLGRSLRDHFLQIEHTRQLVKATAQSIASGTTAELNIGIMCTVGAEVISQAIAHFRAKHPGITLVLHDVVPRMSGIR